MRKTLKQFIKFGFAGGIATLINLTFLYLLTEFFGLYYLISAIFAFFIADISKYFISNKWVFNDGRKRTFFKTYSKFFMISITALIFNLSILYVFTEFFGIYYMLSQIFAIMISLWVNFIGNKFWTFKMK